MTTYVLTYRAVKGSVLTADEFDANIHNLDDRVTVLELDVAALSDIASAYIDTGGHLHLVKASSEDIDAGPLPEVSFNDLFTGEWQAGHSYTANQLFTENGNLYSVLIDHVSSTSFDPNDNDGMGNDFYSLVIAAPTGLLPVGGANGQVLTKQSATDYDADWQDTQAVVPTVQTKTAASFTLALADANTYNRCTNLAGCVVTIPDNATVPFDVGTEIHFWAQDSILFDWSTDITVNFPADSNALTDVSGAVVTLKKYSTDAWDLFGKLQLASV